MECSSPSFPVLHHLPEVIKLMSTESMMPSNHLTLCHPLILLPSICPSIRVFSNESALLIRWSKYWNFSFSISPSMNSQGWIHLGWLVWSPCSPTDSQESSPTPLFKASVLQHSAFNMVQLSHPYMTTAKTIALTVQSFVSKVMSLLFITLSRFVIVFLSRSKHLFFNLFFHWKIIALQNFVVFCQISTWIRHRCLQGSNGETLPWWLI